MRKPTGISAMESTIVICLITTTVVWVVSGIGYRLSRPFEQVAGDVNRLESMASMTSNIDSFSTGNHYQSLPQLMLFGTLTLLGLALTYRCFPQSSSRNVTRRTLLKHLKKQIQSGHLQCSKLLEKRERIFRALSSDLPSMRSRSIRAADIMSLEPRCVFPDTAKQRVIRQMVAADLHHMMVCDKEGKLVGVISDRDLHNPNCQIAREMMTPHPLTVQVSAQITEAISLMIGNRISCVPVLDGENLVGVISFSDIAVTLQCTMSLFSGVFFPSSADITDTIRPRNQLPQ